MATYSPEVLERIFDRTDGRCHLCWRRLAFANYGQVGRRGAWHVDHSRPQSRGGANDRRNYYAACVRCNCAKGNGRNASVRRQHGRSRAPLSGSRRRERQRLNGTAAGSLTWLLLRGAMAGGPAVALALAVAAVVHEVTGDA